MRGVAIALLAVGCNQVFSLDETHPGAEMVDADGDGVDDDHDNCPAIANAMQEDVDRDLVGDLCDNCPVIANANQDAKGDADSVGDLCDPEPTIDGDCLALLDTFSDPAAFDAGWMVLEDFGAPAGVTPSAGKVEIAPSVQAQTVQIVARDITGLLDVQAIAVLDRRDRDNVTSIATSGGSVAPGYLCQRLGDMFAAGTISTLGYKSLSAPPLSDEVVFRLGVAQEDATHVRIQCRIDYGFAVGADQVSSDKLYAGGPGVYVHRLSVAPVNVIVEAIAAYRTQPGMLCPPPVRR